MFCFLYSPSGSLIVKGLWGEFYLLMSFVFSFGRGSLWVLIFNILPFGRDPTTLSNTTDLEPTVLYVKKPTVVVSVFGVKIDNFSPYLISEGDWIESRFSTLGLWVFKAGLVGLWAVPVGAVIETLSRGENMPSPSGGNWLAAAGVVIFWLFDPIWFLAISCPFFSGLFFSAELVIPLIIFSQICTFLNDSSNLLSLATSEYYWWSLNLVTFGLASTECILGLYFPNSGAFVLFL